jgi:hypothetical protein
MILESALARISNKAPQLSSSQPSNSYIKMFYGLAPYNGVLDRTSLNERRRRNLENPSYSVGETRMGFWAFPHHYANFTVVTQ